MRAVSGQVRIRAVKSTTSLGHVIYVLDLFETAFFNFLKATFIGRSVYCFELQNYHLPPNHVIHKIHLQKLKIFPKNKYYAQMRLNL